MERFSITSQPYKNEKVPNSKKNGTFKTNKTNTKSNCENLVLFNQHDKFSCV